MKKFDHVTAQQNFTVKSVLRQNKGQLIVEYLLLIFIVTVAAVLMSKLLVGRADGDSGVIITKWAQLLEMIGADIGD